MPNRPLLILLLIWIGANAACGARSHGGSADEARGARGRAGALAWLRAARFEDADPATRCQPDCREQERGFAYARAHAVDQPGDCDLARVQAHASEDFIEGCRAYGQYLEAAARQQ